MILNSHTLHCNCCTRSRPGTKY